MQYEAKLLSYQKEGQWNEEEVVGMFLANQDKIWIFLLCWEMTKEKLSRIDTFQQVLTVFFLYEYITRLKNNNMMNHKDLHWSLARYTFLEIKKH
jgi:hypothetical protein